MSTEIAGSSGAEEMREVELDGEKVVLVKGLSEHTYTLTWCPSCGLANWIWHGRHDFSSVRCWNCKTLFMEDDESLLEIVDHYGLEDADGREKPHIYEDD